MKEVVRGLIVTYFNGIKDLSSEGAYEVYRIKNDDKALLEHINVWLEMLSEAKKELEGEDE